MESTPTAPDNEYASEPETNDSGSNAHDSIPLSALQTLVRSPGGVPKSGGKGRNYAWHDTETLAACLAYEYTNNQRQRQKNDERRSEAQERFEPSLKLLEKVHGEFVAKNAPSPWTPVVYGKLGVCVPATTAQCLEQRGGERNSSSVFQRAELVYATVKRDILPAAKHAQKNLRSGESWPDVLAAVNAHVEALCNAPTVGKSHQALLRTCAFIWRWTCPQSDDIVPSLTLAAHAIAEFAISQSDKGLPSVGDAYPQTRAEQRLAGEARHPVGCMGDGEAQRKRARCEELQMLLLEEKLCATREFRAYLAQKSGANTAARCADACDSQTTRMDEVMTTRRELFASDDTSAGLNLAGAALAAPSHDDAHGEAETDMPATKSPRMQSPRDGGDENARVHTLDQCSEEFVAAAPLPTTDESGIVALSSCTNAAPSRRSHRSPKPNVRIRDLE